MTGKASSYDGNGLKKGSWTPEEDRKLVECVQKNGHGSWRKLPRVAGLNRCGKSCRLRWTNYLRPDIKRGKFSEEEERIVVDLHAVLGNKWSAIASHLPGRTDNEIKNFWNTHLKKKLMHMGIDPVTHKPRTDLNFLANLRHFLPVSNLPNLTNDPLESALRLTQLAKIQLLQNILQVLSSSPLPKMDPSNHLFLLSQFSQIQPQEFLQMNRSNLETEEAGSFPAGFPSQNHSFFPRFESTQKPFLDDFSDRYAPPPSNQPPTLISVSSETPTVDQTQNKTCPNDHMIVSNDPPSSISNTFDANWRELIDSDEAIDSYWRDIMDQTASKPVVDQYLLEQCELPRLGRNH